MTKKCIKSTNPPHVHGGANFPIRSTLWLRPKVTDVVPNHNSKAARPREGRCPIKPIHRKGRCLWCRSVAHEKASVLPASPSCPYSLRRRGLALNHGSPTGANTFPVPPAPTVTRSQDAIEDEELRCRCVQHYIPNFRWLKGEEKRLRAATGQARTRQRTRKKSS